VYVVWVVDALTMKSKVFGSVWKCVQYSELEMIFFRTEMQWNFTGWSSEMCHALVCTNYKPIPSVIIIYVFISASRASQWTPELHTKSGVVWNVHLKAYSHVRCDCNIQVRCVISLTYSCEQTLAKNLDALYW